MNMLLLNTVENIVAKGEIAHASQKSQQFIIKNYQTECIEFFEWLKYSSNLQIEPFQHADVLTG